MTHKRQIRQAIYCIFYVILESELFHTSAIRLEVGTNEKLVKRSFWMALLPVILTLVALSQSGSLVCLDMGSMNCLVASSETCFDTSCGKGPNIKCATIAGEQATAE